MKKKEKNYLEIANHIFIVSGREKKVSNHYNGIRELLTDSFSECILRVFFKLKQDLATAFRNA